jgi:hypothetical protein
VNRADKHWWRASTVAALCAPVVSQPVSWPSCPPAPEFSDVQNVEACLPRLCHILAPSQREERKKGTLSCTLCSRCKALVLLGCLKDLLAACGQCSVEPPCEEHLFLHCLQVDCRFHEPASLALDALAYPVSWAPHPMIRMEKCSFDSVVREERFMADRGSSIIVTACNAVGPEHLDWACLGHRCSHELGHRIRTRCIPPPGRLQAESREGPRAECVEGHG